MTLLKIAALGALAVIIISLIKTYRPELATAVSLCTAALLLLALAGSIKEGLGFISGAYENLAHGKEYLPVLLKVLGIAYITEFAAAMCADAGEKSVGSKIELAGKIAVFFAAAPVFTSLLDMLDSLA